MVEFVLFDPKTALDEEWEKLDVWRKIYHQENKPDDPLVPKDQVKILLKQQLLDPDSDSKMYLVKDKDNIVGIFLHMSFKESSPSFRGNEKMMMFDIQLINDYKRQGIATQALKIIAEAASSCNKKALICQTDIPDSKHFFDKIGASIGLQGRENRLYLNKVDWEMVNKWVQEGGEKNPKTKLIIVNTIPEEILEDYAEVYTETMNQQPFGEIEIGDLVYDVKEIRKREKENKEANIQRIIAITIEEDNKVSGLSELIYIPGRNTMISQGLTGVKMEYRGRKLGKWVKASSLLYAKKHFPSVEFITTGNAETNEPMLYINKKLGFKKHKENWMANLKLSDLQDYLHRKVNDKQK